jgi:UPF0042 nucleotide-binding protein
MRIVIVTGLSGAGKSTALGALEDIGFFCVDNLPLPMFSPFVLLMAETGNASDVGISVDARQHPYLGSFRQEMDRLRESGHEPQILFLEAPDEVLLRRYSATRRRHPLSGDDVADGIRRDRAILTGLRHNATVVNTGALTVHQLKAIVQETYGRRDGRLGVMLLSFGFKHGLPPESDLVFDVRFISNPYFEPDLAERDGRDSAVADYVWKGGEARELLDRILGLLQFSLPQFEREGKRYLTIAVGCTGGRHRSVVLVEELAKLLGGDWDVSVRHRDLERVS